jgi:hypothetical protein
LPGTAAANHSSGVRRLLVVVAVAAVVAIGAAGVVSVLHTRGVKPPPASGLPVRPPTEPCSASESLSGTGSLQSYIDASEHAQQHHKTVCLKAGATLTVDATATVAEPALLDFNGATITKAPTMAGPVMGVRGAHVSIVDVSIDGNQRNGAKGGGILWQAAAGLIYEVAVVDTESDGIELTGSGTSLVAERSSSDGNVNAELTGDGFFASAGTRLLTVQTSAEHNDHAGYFLGRVAAGSSVSGSSSFNRFAGLQVEDSTGLRVPNFTSTGDWHYGLYIGGDSTACSIGHVGVLNTGVAQGKLPTNTYGSGMELFGVSKCRVSAFTDVVTDGAGSGYGLALARQPPGEGFVVRGSDGNDFESVHVSGTSNPGIDITGSSSDNTIVNATASRCAVGFNIGEGTVANDGNVFDHVVLQDDVVSGIGVESSNGNIFKVVQLLDVGSRYQPQDGNAQIRLIGSASGNVFGDVTVALSSSAAEPKTYRQPQYVVYADPGTAANRVGLATVAPGSYAQAPFIDHGHNHFMLGAISGPLDPEP